MDMVGIAEVFMVAIVGLIVFGVVFYVAFRKKL